MLFAKSSDRPVDEAQVLEWLSPRRSGPALRTTHIEVPDTGAAGVLGSRPTWMWGLEHGVSAHRVAIGNERVWTTDDPRAVPPGLIGMDLVRLGLERATTADGAVDVITSLLERHGQGGSGEEGGDEPYWSSFLVTDPAAGRVLETSGRTWVAAPVGAGAAISNRLTLRTEWTRSSADVETGCDWDDRRSRGSPTGIADHRLAATRRCIASGRVDPRHAVAVLRDHGTGPWGAPGPVVEDPPAPPAGVVDDWSHVTVCMHVRANQCTTASLVALLPVDPAEPQRTWAALGSPCASTYLPIGHADGEAVVPAVLGDPDVWRSFAMLARAIERPAEAGGEALREVRSVLAPIEADAWDEADRLWSTAADARRWRQAAAGWDRQVRAALAQLSGC